MDSMDNFRKRFEALAQQTEQLKHQTQALEAHTRMVERRRWWHIPWRVAVVVALGLALALPLTAQAKTFHCDGGDVQCLIAAINEANANGQKNTIRLESGTYTLTTPDNPENGLPVIASPVTIIGRGAETTIIERDASARQFRIVAVAATGSLRLRRLALRAGQDSLFGGGGIYNEGTLALAHTTVASNGGLAGGGILTGAVNPGATVTITHSIIADNTSGAGGGGGLLCLGQGLVTLTATSVVRNGSDGGGGIKLGDSPTGRDSPVVIITDSTIANNTTAGTGPGGGIENVQGTLGITNTTIAANTDATFTGSGGGGIANFNGTILLINSTLADNSISGPPVGGSGGGIQNRSGTFSGTVLLQNTLLARNSAPMGPDCSGTVTSLGTNLIGDPTGCTITIHPSDLTGDPGLATFADNGRPGQGHFPLLPTSQAIDAGSDAFCPLKDQLGQRRVNIPRVGTSRCDIGAIEFLGKHDRQHDEEDDQHDMEDD